jgi:hypothetical protein
MTTSIGRRHWWALGALFALASVYWHWMTHSAAYRLALDGAGDIALPARTATARQYASSRTRCRQPLSKPTDRPLDGQRLRFSCC